MKTLCFEVCVQTLEAALAAKSGGADRIELCDRLPVGGVSPRFDLVAALTEEVGLPIHVLIRPRDGDFDFSAPEFEEMRRQIVSAKEAGAAGVAIGVLLPDGRIDIERSRELVELARPMKSTFHRAFDQTPDLKEALEDVIATGVDCLLTSGGEQDVLAGAESIARLRMQAGKRLDVMAGGGLRLDNLGEVVRRTGVSFLHGSLSRKGTSAQHRDSHREDATARSSATLEVDVCEAVRLFRQEFSAKSPAARFDG
jgi:copper homeostasis protein